MMEFLSPYRTGLFLIIEENYFATSHSFYLRRYNDEQFSLLLHRSLFVPFLMLWESLFMLMKQMSIIESN